MSMFSHAGRRECRPSKDLTDCTVAVERENRASQAFPQAFLSGLSLPTARGRARDIKLPLELGGACGRWRSIVTCHKYLLNFHVEKQQEPTEHTHRLLILQTMYTEPESPSHRAQQ